MEIRLDLLKLLAASAIFSVLQEGVLAPMLPDALFDELSEAFVRSFSSAPALKQLKPNEDYTENGRSWSDLMKISRRSTTKYLFLKAEDSENEGRFAYLADRKQSQYYRPSAKSNQNPVGEHVYRILKYAPYASSGPKVRAVSLASMPEGGGRHTFFWRHTRYDNDGHVSLKHIREKHLRPALAEDLLTQIS
ncbi:hypothetical protein BCV70DRAFT_113261 [Testicularia cyperi]|uniref:Uncharacterized protein n=1 Tax=Testicularia cyperi TaxID=1882483 RepID=A0A317XR96_9BASI|nr:hypothetical protein BCV70DRAFT_113261 [Testicularia cyperi]